MGKLKTYGIAFNGNRQVYNPGEVVSGFVMIELTEPLQCRGVRVRFYGEAYVHWTESEGSGDNRRSVSYSARNVYFDEKMTLWGKAEGDRSGENPTLSVGSHQLPFQMQLPHTGLPNSFEGSSYGYVRYIIKSNIDRPWKFDHTTKAAFTVTGVQVDLNKIPHAMYSQQDEAEKTVCCLCCASGPITMAATTDRSGYTPGENIKVGVDVNNVSSRDILAMEIGLVQVVTYTAYRRGNGRAHHRYTRDKVSVIKGQGCEPNGKINWRDQVIHIPPIPATGLEGCHFIDIQYVVNFEADVSGTPFDLNVNIPVTIGNIPLQQVYGYDFSNVSYPPIPGALEPSAPPPPLPDAPQAANAQPPPPSYEAIYSGTTNIKDSGDNDYTYGQLDFAPQYSYYNWDANNSSNAQR